MCLETHLNHQGSQALHHTASAGRHRSPDRDTETLLRHTSDGCLKMRMGEGEMSENEGKQNGIMKTNTENGLVLKPGIRANNGSDGK